MRVIALHAFSFQVEEFNNVTNISWTSGSTVITGEKVGTVGASTYSLSNSIYLIRIITN